MNVDDILFYAAADTHVDEQAWADRPIRGDSMWSFKWICELAQRNNKPLVLAGDVTESQLNNAVIAQFLRKQLRKPSRGVLAIQGQHDLQEVSWLSALDDDNVMWLDWLCDESGEPAELASGIKLWGIDWTPAAKIPELLAKIPQGTDILVMHQVTYELMGSITTPELLISTIPHVRMLIIGDYHKHLSFEVTGASGQKITVLSPGSTNMRAINEPADKFIFAVGKDLSFESIRIPTRLKWSTDITDDEQLDEVIKDMGPTIDKLVAAAAKRGVPEHLQKPLMHIGIDVDIPMIYHRLHSAIGDRAFLFTKELKHALDALEPDIAIPDEEEDEGMQEQLDQFGAISCLPLVVNEEEDPEVFRFCQRVLGDEDINAVLDDERSKYITSGASAAAPTSDEEYA
jgi:hypothetical protein